MVLTVPMGPAVAPTLARQQVPARVPLRGRTLASQHSLLSWLQDLLSSSEIQLVYNIFPLFSLLYSCYITSLWTTIRTDPLQLRSHYYSLQLYEFVYKLETSDSEQSRRSPGGR